MISTERIAKNIGLFYVAQITGYLLNFLYITRTARYLGSRGFGLLCFALAFTGIFGILTDLGLRRVITRDVARRKELTNKYLGNAALIKIALAGGTYALIALFTNLLGYPSDTARVVYILGLSVVLNSFSQLFYSIFQAYERMEFESVGHILNSVLLLGGGLLAIANGLGVRSFAYLYFLTSAVIFGYTFFISLWKFPRPRMEADWGFWVALIKQALPFGLIGVFEVVYHWMDTVMLEMMQGSAVVGWYNAAYRLVFMSLFIPSAVNAAVFPVMSRCYASSEDALKLIQQKYFTYMSMIGAFMGITTTLFAREIILLIFGEAYRPSIGALQVLIWSSVLIFLNGAFVRLFESVNRQGTITKIAGAGALFNVILNLMLIPKWSYIGAGVATVLCELLITVCVMVAASRTRYRIETSLIVRQLARLSLAGLVMTVVAFLSEGVHLVVMFGVSTLAYFALIYLLRGFGSLGLAERPALYTSHAACATSFRHRPGRGPGKSATSS